MINLTPQQLRKAANIQEKIQALQKELGQLLGDSGPAESAESEAPKKRKKVSAAGRARMKAAQKARWAKIKGEAKPVSKPEKAKAPKKKRKMTPAWKAALARAWEARRAKAKAAAKGKP